MGDVDNENFETRIECLLFNVNYCMSHQSPILNFFMFVEEVFECLCRLMKCKSKIKKVNVFID